MDAHGRDENGRRPGDLVFAWTALRALAAHRVRFEPALEIDGHGRAAFALVANARSVQLRRQAAAARCRAAPASRAASTWSRRGRCARGTCRAPCATSLTGRTGLPLVLLHDSDRIEIRCDRPMPLQLDGEDLGDVTEVVFEAERDAVSVLVGDG